MFTVSALFDRIEDAHQAIRGLKDSGFRQDDISLISRDTDNEYSRYIESSDTTTTGETGEKAAAGAGIGAVLGGLGGLLVGLGALAIPGVGPIIAAGPLAGALAGAGIGAAAGGLLGALTELGIPEEQANFYAEGVRRGGTLVVVRVDDNRADEAVSILNRFNPVNVNDRSTQWKQDNWTRFDESAEPYTSDRIPAEQSSYMSGMAGTSGATGASGMTGMQGSTREMRDGEEVNIPIVEEEMRVGKREVERGGVRVETHMKEEPFQEDVNLRRERINVERVPMDVPVTGADMEAFKEDSIEMTERAEEAVVDKQARIVEEVRLRKDVEQETQTVSDTLRRTEVDIQKFGPEWNEREPRYQQHYNTYYSTMGRDYNYYRPAYAFGYQMANDDRYRGMDWVTFEPEARREWDRTHGDTMWDDIKDAVRSAWASVTR